MDVDAYLERLGYGEPLEPSLESLRGLHLAHLRAVPFENLDIHLGRSISLLEPAMFDKVVRRRRGGFCYELNGLFAALLRALGFQVTLLSARVARETGGFGPDFDHLALRVDLDTPWLADVGFGDAFLEPLPLLEGAEVCEGNRAYRLERAGEDWTLLERRAGEGWRPRYTFTLAPRRLSDFEAMSLHHQRSPESGFTRKRVCTLATAGGRVSLTGDTLTTVEGEERRERALTDPREVEEALERLFGVVIAPGRNAATQGRADDAGRRFGEG